jgi:O-methyltransferase
MSGAALPKLNMYLRIPWYKFWKLIERSLYAGRSYTLHIPFGQRVYTPWFEMNPQSEFTRVMQSVRASGPQWYPIDKCYMLYQLARRSQQLPGDMAECGVYKGETAQLLAWILASGNAEASRLHLFDTFAGMPKTCIPDRDYHKPGDFSDTSLGEVQKRLGRHASLCVFHPGVIPKTFAEVADVAQYSFVHVDVDIYPAVRDCCQWFWPRLTPGGVMVFNVYGLYPYRFAERVAVDEFFAKHIEQPIVLPTGQAIVMKT